LNFQSSEDGGVNFVSIAVNFFENSTWLTFMRIFVSPYADTINDTDFIYVTIIEANTEKVRWTGIDKDCVIGVFWEID
jgi:hypothetical protein